MDELGWVTGLCVLSFYFKYYNIKWAGNKETDERDMGKFLSRLMRQGLIWQAGIAINGYSSAIINLVWNFSRLVTADSTVFSPCRLDCS